MYIHRAIGCRVGMVVWEREMGGSGEGWSGEGWFWSMNRWIIEKGPLKKLRAAIPPHSIVELFSSFWEQFRAH